MHCSGHCSEPFYMDLFVQSSGLFCACILTSGAFHTFNGPFGGPSFVYLSWGVEGCSSEPREPLWLYVASYGLTVYMLYGTFGFQLVILGYHKLD